MGTPDAVPPAPTGPFTGSPHVPFIQHYKVIHSGYFGPVGAPVEFWSHSLAVSAVSPFLVRSDLPAIAASCRTAWSSLASSINNTCG